MFDECIIGFFGKSLKDLWGQCRFSLFLFFLCREPIINTLAEREASSHSLTKREHELGSVRRTFIDWIIYKLKKPLFKRKTPSARMVVP